MEPLNQPLKYRLAIAGFRHKHALGLLRKARLHPRITVTALCEENFEASLLPSHSLVPDYTSFQTMLEESECEIVGLGDIFSKRGEQAILALQKGRHVISDKPLCTSLEQLEIIAAIASQKKLSVGLTLGLRKRGNFIAMKERIQSGQIGDVQTITITGQHPLRQGKRPAWFFEKGLHGGTFNDIGIHAVDLVQWLTGQKISQIVAARTWNAKADFAPHFNDCAQCMLRLENGAGVLGDFSYLAPDRCGAGMENYWRTSVHGTRGFVETCSSAQDLIVADDSSTTPERLPSPEKNSPGYLDDLLAEMEGTPLPDAPTTASFLSNTRIALELEKFADS